MSPSILVDEWNCCAGGLHSSMHAPLPAAAAQNLPCGQLPPGAGTSYPCSPSAWALDAYRICLPRSEFCICTFALLAPPLQERIIAAGGRLIWNNGLRVMGALGMSRALGDHLLQAHGVSAEPDVALLPRSGGEDFLLLATDGLWGAVSNEVGGGRVCAGGWGGERGWGDGATNGLSSEVEGQQGGGCRGGGRDTAEWA
jgi:hypothetical protein